MQDRRYVSFNLKDVVVGQPLPGDLFLYLDNRFITLRAKGDIVDRVTYERLDFKNHHHVFVLEEMRDKFLKWSQSVLGAPAAQPTDKKISKVRDDLHRKALDIFHADHPEKAVTQTLAVSKKLVTEIMKEPYAARPLRDLQSYSQGTVDHSVNVSVLSSYLAMQMGYSHVLILQHVAMGGLLHDIGKTRVDYGDEDNPEEIIKKLRNHPTLGEEILAEDPRTPKEVRLIVAQHHEYYDGTGYPKRMRGSNIYDLARIVCIANMFDELVSEQRGTLIERQRVALKLMDELHYKKFEPTKFEKAIKILKLGI